MLRHYSERVSSVCTRRQIRGCCRRPQNRIFISGCEHTSSLLANGSLMNVKLDLQAGDRLFCSDRAEATREIERHALIPPRLRHNTSIASIVPLSAF